MLRKGNGRNPRVDGSARRADDRFGDDDRPLNKSYETQTQVSTVAKHQPDQTIAAVLELLAETWPKCFSIYEARRQPLKVGVHHDQYLPRPDAASPSHSDGEAAHADRLEPIAA